MKNWAMKMFKVFHVKYCIDIVQSFVSLFMHWQVDSNILVLLNIRDFVTLYINGGRNFKCC